MNGSASRIQFGFETVYGTLPVMTKQLRIKSEGFKYIPNKKGIGVLTGNRGTGASYNMSIKAEGALSSIAYPDEVGYFLANWFGVEATPTLVATCSATYKHTFSLSNPNTTKLPSMSFTVERGTSGMIKAYTGSNLDSMSFSAAAEDFLNVDYGFKFGYDEVNGTLVGGLTPSTLQPLRFSGATMKVGGTTLAQTTSIKFDGQNGLSSFVTSDTGMHFAEPDVGARDVKIDAEVIYATANDTIRTTYLKADTLVALELNFVSTEMAEAAVPYSLKITIPNAQLLAADPNVSGAEMLKQMLSFRMVDTGTGEPITAELINKLATKHTV